MNPYELPAGIEIKRDFEREEKEKLFNPGNLDTFYKILWNYKEAGYASYRLTGSNWKIDWFLIYEENRKNGLGDHLLKYITQKMSSEQRISIKIHTGPNRKELISLVLKNKFQEKDVDYVLYPEDQE